MQKRVAIFLTLLFLFIHPILRAQTKIDSLQKLLSKGFSQADTNLSKLYMQLGEVYLNTQLDSSQKYLELGLQFAAQQKWYNGLAQGNNRLGRIMLSRELKNVAFSYFEEAASFALRAKNPVEEANAFNNMGIACAERAQFDKAVEWLYKALELREQIGDRKGVADTWVNIGIIQYQLGKTEEALPQFRKAIASYRQLGNSRGEAASYTSVGIVYLAAKPDSATHYFRKALLLYEQSQDIKGQCMTLSYLGDIKVRASQLDSALLFFERSYTLAQKAQMPSSMVNVLLSMSRLYLQKKDFQKAIEVLNRASAIDPSQNKQIWLTVLDSYSSVYEAAGEWALAFEYQRKARLLSDSIYQEKNKSLLSGFESNVKLNKAQKELELVQQEKSFERMFFLGGIAILLVMSSLIFIYFKQQKKVNQVLKLSKDKIEEQNEELLRSQEELKSVNDQLDTKNKLVEKTFAELKDANDMLKDSILYAKHIQALILPTSSETYPCFSKVEFYFSPKDVVSGDFYWYRCLSPTECVFIVADCTGHGVPGAMLSMICNALLTQALDENPALEPIDLIRYLENGIVSSLRQREQKNSDGLDLSISKFRKREDASVQMNYCSAKAHLQYWDGNQLITLEKQRVSVGGDYLNKPEFVEHTLDLKKGDRLYIYSDGFIDQNNAARKSFGTKLLKSSIEESLGLPLEEQSQFLISSLLKHKGNESQRDDITMAFIEI